MGFVFACVLYKGTNEDFLRWQKQLNTQSDQENDYFHFVNET